LHHNPNHQVGQSIQGAVVYRGRAINTLYGIMVGGDFGNGNPADLSLPHFFGFRKTRRNWTRFALQVKGAESHDAPVIFVEDERGEIYFTTLSLLDFKAHIYKIVDARIPS
jgi:hypothetical protein